MPIGIIVDIFSADVLSGRSKASWTILIVFLSHHRLADPLIARGPQTTAHEVAGDL